MTQEIEGIELKDALLDTIRSYEKGQKELAYELDYSPSRLSQIIASPEHFPLLKAIRLMRITRNQKCLEILAAIFGYRLERKEIPIRALVEKLAEKLNVEPKAVSEAIEDMLAYNIRTGSPWRDHD